MHKISLDENQKKVVETLNGPVLVVAGAGSGKTTTIVERIANLINGGVNPENILAITFTNKAANEMKERVKTRLSLGYGSEPFISTFHSLCVRLLREFYKEAGLKKSFSIYDRDDSIKVIKEAMKYLGVDNKQISASAALSIISKYKNMAKSLSDLENNSYFKRQMQNIWRKYDELLFESNALDFDDLLIKTNKLLQENQEIRKKLSNRFKYIHVDEYQDTNIVQFYIVQHLAQEHKNICVVGDIDQAIYGFRNARPENLLDFEKAFPNTKTIFLNRNYRSSKTIVEASDAVISKNVKRFKKESIPTIDLEEKINLKKAVSAQDEAAFVADEIKELVEKHGYSHKDIAVLYRTNFQSRQFEEFFIKKQIPYQVLGVRFFNRKEIKDILSFLRASFNPASLADLSRAVSSVPVGIGKKTLSYMILKEKDKIKNTKKVDDFYKKLTDIKEFALKAKLSETILFILKESGIQAHFEKTKEIERIENIYELSEFAKKYDDIENKQEAIDMFLEDISLMSDQDEYNSEDRVRLLTVHAAKGLEFPVVFVVGLEQGLFPHQAAQEQEDGTEEERRLFYVAITRAKQKLYLSYAFIRTVRGQTVTNELSEFVNDIPTKFLKEIDGEAHSVGLLDDIQW